MHSLRNPTSAGSLISSLSAVCLRHSFISFVAAFAVLCLGQRTLADSVSFRNEIMAVLSKAGCNQGACHGNQNGKNGFKLSLRGEDAAFDFKSLTRDTFGRR